ncbi:MAG TPA: hypothetical protein VGN52_00330 [Burkholderiales bacterium]
MAPDENLDVLPGFPIDNGIRKYLRRKNSAAPADRRTKAWAIGRKPGNAVESVEKPPGCLRAGL